MEVLTTTKFFYIQKGKKGKRENLKFLVLTRRYDVVEC
jgi:hypothetical protein